MQKVKSVQSLRIWKLEGRDVCYWHDRGHGTTEGNRERKEEGMMETKK